MSTDDLIRKPAEPAANATKYCYGCGKALHVSALSCPGCGATQSASGKGRKDRVIAIVLALILGGFGAHKFYLGRVGWGVVYLLFFWTAIPAIAAFVEAILYILMSDEEFAAKYG